MTAAEALEKGYIGPKKRVRVQQDVKPPTPSKGEALLAEQIVQVGLPFPEQQFYWAQPERQFQADFAYPQWRILVEVQGGGTRGSHQNQRGYADDCRRLAWATKLKWYMLYFTTEQVLAGEAINILEEIVKNRMQESSHGEC